MRKFYTKIRIVKEKTVQSMEVGKLKNLLSIKKQEKMIIVRLTNPA